jgi:hypothetical protein
MTSRSPKQPVSPKYPCRLCKGNHLLKDCPGRHGSKYGRGDCLHGIHVATTKKNIIVEWGINNINVYKDGFAPDFDGDIVEEPLGRRGLSVVSPQSNRRWYYLWRAKFLPNDFGHDACGYTFINYAAVNDDVSDFNRYLKSDKSGETGFSTVEIKCDESSISRVDCP